MDTCTTLHENTWETNMGSSYVAMDCDVSYTWSAGHGLIAEMVGAVKYLAETGLNYVEPTKPLHQHAGIVANTSQHRTRVLTAAND